MRRLTIVVVGFVLAGALAAPAARAQRCGDPDANGVDDVDATNVLRTAVGLPSACAAAPAACDVDASGAIDVVDAANVLHRAAGLPAVEACLPRLRLTEIARSFDRPLFAGAPAGDPTRLFVVEQPGRIRIVKNGTVLERAFLDLAAEVTGGGEQGLLGLAFHPDYAANGRFFVNYTDRGGDTVIAEYARAPDDPDRADPEATRVFFTVDQPFANHNGGMVAFGPDGFLYVGLGDGGGAGDSLNNAQRATTKLGKILRIDVDRYPVPAPGNLPGGDPDVWDLGLRNPFRFSFDRTTGDLYIGDVGQNLFEEIDFEPRGAGGRNYGWRILEGLHCFSPQTGCDPTGTTLPVVEYAHDDGCSVIGGYVYRGEAMPLLAGRYLYGDFCSGRVWSFAMSGGTAMGQVDLTADLNVTGALTSITSFGEDAAGELYVVSGQGAVFRIDPE